MGLKIGPSPDFTNLINEDYKHFDEPIIRNISSCKELCAIPRTSFGPQGTNKLISNHLGKLFVTNHAATLVKEMEVVHPAAKIIAMASQQQETEHGNSTNLIFVFTGELLTQAEALLKLGIHKNHIVDGYKKASNKAKELLESLVVSTVTEFNETSLLAPVRTAIASKKYGLEDFLSDLVVKACLLVLPGGTVKNIKSFNTDSIRVVKILGASIHESQVINGMVFGREPESQVTKASKAKVAVYSCPLDIGRTETKGTVLIGSSKELLDFSKGEEKLIEKQFEEIAASGVQVLVTGGTIGDLSLHFINRFKLLAIKVPSKFDLQRLCRVIGATAMARLGAPTPEEMGYCDVVERLEIGGDKCTVFRQEAETSKTCTILLRGSTLNYLEDVERALANGINVVKSLKSDGRLLAGAGATEIQLGERLADFGEKTPGVEQYAIKKYAQALEAIPRTICQNGGYDYSQVLAALYSEHSRGNAHCGVNVERGSGSLLVNAVERGILDLYISKKSALELSVDAAISIIKIDSIIMSKPAGGPKPRKPTSLDAADD